MLSEKERQEWLPTGRLIELYSLSGLISLNQRGCVEWRGPDFAAEQKSALGASTWYKLPGTEGKMLPATKAEGPLAEKCAAICPTSPFGTCVLTRGHYPAWAGVQAEQLHWHQDEAGHRWPEPDPQVSAQDERSPRQRAYAHVAELLNHDRKSRQPGPRDGVEWELLKIEQAMLNASKGGE